MKKIIIFSPVILLIIISLYPFIQPSTLSISLTKKKEETTSLPSTAKDVIVIILDSSSSGRDVLDREYLSVVYNIHTTIRNMEGVRGYSTLFNTPVVKAEEDEILVLPYIPEDLLITYDQEKIDRLKAQYENFPEIHPYISRDFFQCVFYIEPGRSYSPTKLMRGIEELKRKIEHNNTLTLDFTGLRPVRMYIEQFLTRDIMKILPILFFLISFLYIILFRNIKILIISWCIKIIATTAAYGMYIFFFKEISPLIIIIPVFNTGLLSDYLIHMFYHTRSKGYLDLYLSARKFLAIPLSLTALTSIIGFISLILFGSGGHLLLGFTISLSILFTYLLTLLFIPGLQNTGLLRQKPLHRTRGIFIKRIQRILTLLFLSLYKRRVSIFIYIIIILTGSLLNIRNLKMQPYPLKQLPAESTIIKAETTLNEKFSGTIPFMIEIDTARTGALLGKKNLLRIENLHTILRSNQDIGFQHSLLTIIKKIHFYFNNSDPAYLTIPDVDDSATFSSLIEQYLLFFSASTSPEEYESLIDPDFRTASIKGILKYRGTESMTRFESSFKQLQESIDPDWRLSFFGPVKELITTTNNLKNNWLISFVIGSLLIFFTVFIFFRDVKMSFLSLVPSFAIIIIVTGLAPLLNIKIDEYTIIFIAITTGLTIDYTIHILNAIKKMKKEGIKRDILGYGFHVVKSGGVPVFLSFLTSVTAFAMLFLSSFSGAVHLAAMLTIAITCAFFIGGFILPMFFVPKGNEKVKDHPKSPVAERRGPFPN